MLSRKKLCLLVPFSQWQLLAELMDIYSVQKQLLYLEKPDWFGTCTHSAETSFPNYCCCCCLAFSGKNFALVVFLATDTCKVNFGCLCCLSYNGLVTQEKRRSWQTMQTMVNLFVVLQSCLDPSILLLWHLKSSCSQYFTCLATRSIYFSLCLSSSHSEASQDMVWQEKWFPPPKPVCHRAWCLLGLKQSDQPKFPEGPSIRKVELEPMFPIQSPTD